MNKHLKQLVALADLDREIDNFLPEEERINGKLNQLLTEQDGKGQAIASLEEEIAENRMKKSKNELHLQELSDKLASISAKSDQVKTEKEIKALQLEEEIAKEQIAFANEEIGRLDKIEKAKEEEIGGLKAEIDAADAAIEEARNASADELKGLEEKRKAAFESKEKLVAQIPQKILSFYQKVRRWAGNSTVVPVKKQACYGCHMKLGDRVYGEVIASDEIVTCPHCGRILYTETETEEAR